ncbi:hypothetical protein RIF29_20547 [Crotalaria pallida]|uniref:cDENN domain-containing protein n=1 Tax=Crotalaria pallida TaxID=3830 RepID=A0AAN9F1S0_CROPI
MTLLLRVEPSQLPPSPSVSASSRESRLPPSDRTEASDLRLAAAKLHRRHQSLKREPGPLAPSTPGPKLSVWFSVRCDRSNQQPPPPPSTGALGYHRLDEAVLHLDDTMVDLKSSSTGLELPEAYNSLLAEEEATALSIWAVACMCGALRLEHMLTFFTAALLEKQIVVVCSNLISVDCLLGTVVLPNDLLEFLDAPVPYIVGIRNKTNEVQSKLTNATVVDACGNLLNRTIGLLKKNCQSTPVVDSIADAEGNELKDNVEKLHRQTKASRTKEVSTGEEVPLGVDLLLKVMTLQQKKAIV